MSQKLSAMNYIRNNKRRVAVLIVSLALFLILVYLTMFILSSATESFRLILVEDTKKVQHVRLPDSAFGIDAEVLGEAAGAAYAEAEDRLMEELGKQEGVEEIYRVQCMGVTIYAMVGQYHFEFPLGDEKMLTTYMEHMGATLAEGRMPQAPGELILAEGVMKNAGLKLGQKLADEAYQIVGIADSDSYFGSGIKVPERDYSEVLCILTDGSVTDMTNLLREMGYEFAESDAWIFDHKKGCEEYEQVWSEVETPTTLVFRGVTVVMAVMLLLVYTTTLRDRHAEWCLYCSIGYGRKDIYLSILREMLFCFGIAVCAGTLFTVIGMVVIDKTLISPMGLACNYLDFSVIGVIICGYAVVFALLQIPIRYAMYKICTVDVMEDELH